MGFFKKLIAEQEPKSVKPKLNPVQVKMMLLSEPYLDYDLVFDHYGSTQIDNGTGVSSNLLHFYESDERMYDLMSKLKGEHVLFGFRTGDYTLSRIEEMTDPDLPKWCYEFVEIKEKRK